MQTQKSIFRRAVPWLVLLVGVGSGWAVWPKNPGGEQPGIAAAQDAAAKDGGGKEGKGFKGKGASPDKTGNADGGRRGGNGPVSAAAVAASTADIRIVQTGLGNVVSRNTVTGP